MPLDQLPKRPPGRPFGSKDSSPRIVVNKLRSQRQQQRILDTLIDAPLSTYAIADQLHMSRAAVVVHLRELMARPRKVRVADFEYNGGRPRKLYGMGIKRDLTFDEWMDARVLAHFSVMQSMRQLATGMGFAYTSVHVYVRRLHDAQRIHVAGWLAIGNTTMPLYRVGNLPDVPRPLRRLAMPSVALPRKPGAWAAALGL